MRFLITGGCGFIGSNLSAEILKRGNELLVFDNLYRAGAAENLKWLNGIGKFDFERSDIRDFSSIEGTVRDFRPDCVFHLAGQVAMTTSIKDPRLDFEVNAMGGHNLIESVRRHAPQALVIYSSTNKVYGSMGTDSFLEQDTRYVSTKYPNGVDESVPLDFQSPYGCSKGATDQVMLDYGRVYGMNTVVFRHSSVYGGRQFSTFDQGWIGWFVQQAVDQKNGISQSFTIAGSGKQVRDVLYISDLIDCYLKVVENPRSLVGKAFNLGGGLSNSLSLLELFGLLEVELGIRLKFEQTPWRLSDQKVFVADISKIENLLGWSPKIDKVTGIRRMLDWVREK